MKIKIDDIETTWEEFAKVNNQNPNLLNEIKTALDKDGVYQGGGGAEAEYTIVKI